MIVALLTLLFLGGGSTYLLEAIDFYQDRAEDVIPKGEQRKQVNAVFDAMEDSTDRRHDMIENVVDQLDKLLRDKDVADVDLDAVLSYYRDGIETYQREMLDHRFELKGHLNREQWQAVFSTPPSDAGY